MNRGKYRYPIIIQEKRETETTNDLGYYDTEYVQVKRFFANIESRVGSLLSSRPADTVVTSVTHKITYPEKEYPNIMPDKNIIIYNNKRFEVNYSMKTNFYDDELQVFVTEITTHKD